MPRKPRVLAALVAALTVFAPSVYAKSDNAPKELASLLKNKPLSPIPICYSSCNFRQHEASFVEGGNLMRVTYRNFPPFTVGKEDQLIIYIGPGMVKDVGLDGISSNSDFVSRGLSISNNGYLSLTERMTAELHRRQ